MKLLSIILPSLLCHATTAVARASPIPRQLSHLSDPWLNTITKRQAPSISGPSTLSTATVSAALLTSTTIDDTNLATDAPSTTTTTTTPSSNPTSPRNHNIAVAQNSTQFTPTTLKNIPIGDTLTFYFYPSNYSIIQSSFSAPCTPLKRDGGVDQRAIFSGFHPTPNSAGIAPEKFVVTVKSTETTWFYAVDGTQLATSAEKTVCERGMVMVVNPLPRDKAAGSTLRAYKEDAAAVRGAADVHACPAEVWGGEIIPLSERQRASWVGKHPVGGNPLKNGTVAGSVNRTGSASGGSVVAFQNKAERSGNSLMAVAVLVGACVYGLGI